MSHQIKTLGLELFDHQGNSLVLTEAGRAYLPSIESVAQSPNVAVKISGLGQRDRPWTQEANVPIMRDTIDIFGADRCMFASNFPVDSLVATYETVLAGFIAAIADHPSAERQKLLHDNARRIYRL